MSDFNGQKRGEIRYNDLSYGEGKHARLIVGCSQSDCDNDAELIWFSKDADLTPPEREVNCRTCDQRIDDEEEARREARVVTGYDQDRIKDLLLGHSVSVVRGIGLACDSLVLDDGTRLEIAVAQDCCSGYAVESLNDSPNLITSVEFSCEAEGPNSGDEVMRVFVLAEDQRINLVEVGGNPGSGYYATGYHFVVTKPGDGAPESDWYEVRR